MILCRICVLGQVDARWSDFLGGLQIDCQRNDQGVTFSKLSGLLPDQSSLFGVLNVIHDLGLTLVFVKTRFRATARRGD